MSLIDIFMLVVIVSFLIYGYRMFRYAREARRFLSFARENFYETWEYLTSYKNLGSGFNINPLRAFLFFAGNETCSDPFLEQARQRVKGRIVSAFLALGSVIGSAFLLFGYATFKAMHK